ncbi:MAG: type II toxin-antitoxin system VapC family toxin [Pseudonocardiales bacterium]
MAIVIDASALAEVVARSKRAGQIEEIIDRQPLIAPDLINSEVLSVLRRWLAKSLVDLPSAERAVHNLTTAPVRRFTTSTFIDEMWSTRHNLTPYDAAYVVLARRTGAALLTLDQRLTQAPALGIPLLTIRNAKTAE